jgi:hypothetical protein
LTYDINHHSVYGEYAEFMAKTQKIRKGRPPRFGVFLCNADGTLIAPRIPVALLEVGDTLRKSKISGFTPGNHNLTAMPVRDERFTREAERSKGSLLIHWTPVEPWLPLGELCIHIPIGPFEISKDRNTDWNNVPVISAQDICESSGSHFPFSKIPAVLVKRYKEAIAKEMIKQCK